jgi:hypothetical protein
MCLLVWTSWILHLPRECLAVFLLLNKAREMDNLAWQACQCQHHLSCTATMPRSRIHSSQTVMFCLGSQLSNSSHWWAQVVLHVFILRHLSRIRISRVDFQAIIFFRGRIVLLLQISLPLTAWVLMKVECFKGAHHGQQCLLLLCAHSPR